MPLLLPPRPFLVSIAIRTLLAWALVRAVLAHAFTTDGPTGPGPVQGHPIVSLGVILVVVLAMRFELGRRSEFVVLANLGYSFVRMGVLMGAECALLEAVLWAVVS